MAHKKGQGSSRNGRDSPGQRRGIKVFGGQAVQAGGPSGGDGGDGGSVIFIADPQLTTLLDYRYLQHHRASSGQNGMGSDCNGASADDLTLKVPVGTLVKDAARGELLCDLSAP